MYTAEEEFEIDRIQREFSMCTVKPTCTRIIESKEMVIMRDSVSLKTLVFRPDKQGVFPTIIVRTCYLHNDYIYHATALEYAKRGFAYVYQYCRGTGGSEGEWEPNIHERNDGIDTLNWLCQQTWVEDVGYWGCSYLALTGWAIADILPDKVKTMYLTHYGALRHTSAYKDGMFRHDVLTAWAMENAGFPITADYIESCKYQPHIEVDEKLWGQKIEWYRDWISNAGKNDEYWNIGFWNMLKEIPPQVKVPIYMGEGWYDHHLGSAIETYELLSPKIKEASTFLIGGWDHSFLMKLEDNKGLHYENNDILRAFNWFFHILVKKEKTVGNIKYYVVGADKWVTVRRDASVKQQYKTFYLNCVEEEKQKLIQDERMTLSEEKQPLEALKSFYYNPKIPVLTYGAESLLYTKEKQGSLCQPKAGYRADVISCISSPLNEDFVISGKIEVDLFVETDAEDTAFVVKVMEVMENGKAYNLRTGVTTLGYRNHAENRRTYLPHQKVKITIDMWDICWKLKKGSKIRLDITSSDFPQYSIHSNYAGCWSAQRESKIAKQTIFIGGNSLSVIKFPLLPE